MSEPRNDPDAAARLLRRRVSARSLELPVTGTSMAGTIESGSRVWVRSRSRPSVGEVWAVVSDDGEVMVHRVRQVGDDVIVTRGSGNPIDDAPLGQARLVGRVVRAESPSGNVTSFDDWDRMKAATAFTLRRFARRMLSAFKR